MKEIKLKNGSTEVDVLVKTTMMALRGLLEHRKDGVRGAICFYDLVMKCRDREYKIERENESYLKDRALLQNDGTPHSSLRNIILSGVVGDGLEMRLQNPDMES